MGAKTWMLVLAVTDARAALETRPTLDRAAAQALATRLFPDEALEPLADGSLDFTNPPDNELLVGCFRGLAIVAAKEFALDRPSTLDPRFIAAGGRGSVQLYAMHSVVDWFAYARWSNGVLMRSVSLSPDGGVTEDIGARLPFEHPYWAGEHAVDDGGEDVAYPLPFHPLEFGEATLGETLGFQYEGYREDNGLDPEEIPLLRYRRSASKPTRRSMWAFWR